MPKSAEKPKMLVPLPPPKTVTDTTLLVGREVWVGNRSIMGTIRSVDPSRKQLDIQYPGSDRDRYGEHEQWGWENGIMLFPSTKEELNGVLESLLSEAEEVQERITYLENKGKSLLSEPEFKAVKLLNQIKNEENEDKQLNLLINSRGF